MGFANVYAVTGGTTAWKAAGLPLVSGADEPAEPLVAEARARVRSISPAELAARLASADRRACSASSRATVRRRPRPGRTLAAARLAGAAHRRPRRRRIGDAVVVTDEDGHDAVLAAATLLELGYRDVAALAGGIEAWRRTGRPLEQGLTGVSSRPTMSCRPARIAAMPT